MTQFGIAFAAAAAFAATGASARDQVSIAGSSTVLPYAQIVAEAFGEAFPDFSAVVEGGGSSGGLKRFCEGLGANTIDIANASRSIREREITACGEAAVNAILEIKFGYDGIVFAYDINGESFDLTPSDVYAALSHEVGGQPNPNSTLADVNPDFPAWDIAFYVPASNHGTREVFEEKVILQGCEDTGDMQAYMDGGMSEDDAEAACFELRGDGAVVEIVGDYTETLARIDSNKTGVGVFGLAFFENNKDKLQVADMGGVTPTQATIASGEYPVSRPLFFYVKRDHLPVIPGLKEYVEFFISEAMTGPGSPTVNYGLVAAPEAEREETRANFANLVTIQ